VTASAPDRSLDQARISVRVAVTPELAFRIFTEDIDLWWRQGPQYRAIGAGRGILHIEPGVGGRLYEGDATGGAQTIVETGRVRVWDPPKRLLFDWRAVNFAPDETTEVEVTFEPSPSGTLVTVTHRGWSQIRDRHPVRHGLDGPAFLRMIGMWWGGLLTSLREHAPASG
jgi:uncharacterized protein YndB with AHSA1/START domain